MLVQIIIQAEVKRLQEWYKQVEEEMVFARELFLEKLRGASNDSTSDMRDFRIKIRWKAQNNDPTNGGYNYDNLYQMFSKVMYDNLSTLLYCMLSIL